MNIQKAFNMSDPTYTSTEFQPTLPDGSERKLLASGTIPAPCARQIEYLKWCEESKTDMQIEWVSDFEARYPSGYEGIDNENARDLYYQLPFAFLAGKFDGMDIEYRLLDDGYLYFKFIEAKS